MTLYEDITRALAERDARIEGLTIERDFHRETADLHAARIAELEAAVAQKTKIVACGLAVEAALEAQIAAMEPVLFFYADKARWENGQLDNDKGERARTVLTAINDGKMPQEPWTQRKTKNA